jgi:hypothetical protein
MDVEDGVSVTRPVYIRRVRILVALLLVACGSTPSVDGGPCDASCPVPVDASVVDSSLADAGSDPFAATVLPTSAGILFRLAFQNTVFEVDPDDAGRIVTFSLDGVNVLVPSGTYFGSVFWPSPQSAWPGGWPPPAEFDTTPYSGGIEGNAIVLHGTAASSAFHMLRVTKRFTANAEHQVVTIEYTLHNDGVSTAMVAPWEITRVRPGGLIFFPDSGASLIAFSNPAIPFTSAESARWFEYRAAAITASSKSGADATEGWAAHVDCHATLERTCGGPSLVLIKSFADVAPATFAPGEAEVELYADGAHGYVELEDQGSYAAIPAGGERTWVMHWYLRELPSLATLNGNPALLDFVRSQL